MLRARFDQPLEQRAMAQRLVFTCRGTEQGDPFPLGDHRGQFIDELLLSLHFLQVASLVLLPTDRLAVLAVVIGVQVAAGAEGRTPTVPGFILLANAARP